MGKKPIASKANLWLKHYLNQRNPTTFLHPQASAKKAGYNPKTKAALSTIGNYNVHKFTPEIEKWLDEEGLSEKALKAKLLSLLDAKKTQFFQKDGIVTDEREVKALETQRRALDMAIKIRGMYATEKKEVTVKSDIPVQLRDLLDNAYNTTTS